MNKVLAASLVWFLTLTASANAKGGYVVACDFNYEVRAALPLIRKALDDANLKYSEADVANIARTAAAQLRTTPAGSFRITACGSGGAPCVEFVCD